MPMIACPGCGLPREADQVGVVPCPLCADGSNSLPAPAPAPEALRPAPLDRIAGLPADASQLTLAPAHRKDRAGSRVALAAVFLLGIGVGAGGIVVSQRLMRSMTQQTVAIAGSPGGGDRGAPLLPPPLPIPSAPMPREGRGAGAVAFPAPPDPRKIAPHPLPDLPRAAHVEPIHLNQPNAVYTLPPLAGKGEHVALSGKVRMLRVNGLAAGSVLDASELEAGSIFVCGRIEEGSFVKLRCADGVVEVPAAVGGRSRLEIDAPGGRVRFVYPTAAGRSGSLIDGGATVVITARTVDLRGDVAGSGTRVSVTLTRNGSLQAAGIRDRAMVEYRSEKAADREPPASAAVVDPNATFRKVE